MTVALSVIGVIFVFLGSVVTLITAVGIVTMPSLYARMHVSAKPQTFGVLLMCLGLAISFHTVKAIAVAIIVIAVQYLTVPISSHMLGRATFRAHMGSQSLLFDEYADDIHRSNEHSDAGADEVGDRVGGGAGDNGSANPGRVGVEESRYNGGS